MSAAFHITEIGQGRVVAQDAAYTLKLPAVDPAAYHDAQISSYATPADLSLMPPLRLSVRASAAQGTAPGTAQGTAQGTAPGMAAGTAGFGLWNHPFAPGERRLRLPRAAWFFYASPPSDMALARDVPGCGWKAATIDAARWPFLALLPLAPPGFLLMRVPALYRALWPVGQRALHVSERLLSDAIPTQAHTYTLDWLPDRVDFHIDGVRVHTSPYSPRGPLGFIAWIDNQYAVVTPQGRFRFGLVDVPEAQTLRIEWARLSADKNTKR